MLVMRADLGMRKGKACAQAAHASLKATLENLEHPSVKEWLADAFAKVTVRVDSEEELFEVARKAREAGLICAVIRDAGRTEFKEPTYTCLAVGPATNEELSPVTGDLKLW